MSSNFPQFDRTVLRLYPLDQRRHDLDLKSIRPLGPVAAVDDKLKAVAAKIVAARKKGASVIFMFGGHLVRSGVQRFVIDLMERGLITCIATNGAGMIHDYELAAIGATTESVARYIKDGRFGLWQETGRINDIVKQAAQKRQGLGEAIGRAIAESDFAHSDISLFATTSRLKVTACVHVGIGYDIVHQHPNCDGAAYGAASYTDFLRYTQQVTGLENGVVINFGSAVMAPEIFLKALAMARNAAHQQNRRIEHFTSLVCDLLKLPADLSREPPKDDPAYYFRPLKTMLVRTVAEGGQGFYVRGRHDQTVPQLWTALTNIDKKRGQGAEGSRGQGASVGGRD